jgi:hypothetical protein
LALVGMLAEKSVVERPGAVLAAIQALPEGTDRQRFISKALDRLTAADPGKALELVARDPMGRAPQGGMINRVILSWSYRDPEAAAAWLDSRRVNPHSGKLFEIERVNVASMWVTTDPDRAIAWLGSMPEGPTKTWGMVHVANHLSSLNPVKSFEMVVSAGADEKVLRRHAGALYKAVPGKASELIRSSGLPDEVKAKLIDRREP